MYIWNYRNTTAANFLQLYSQHFAKYKIQQDRSHQWSTRPDHSPSWQWFWSFGTDGWTDTQCENSDHYRPGLWSASWINFTSSCYSAASKWKKRVIMAWFMYIRFTLLIHTADPHLWPLFLYVWSVRPFICLIFPTTVHLNIKWNKRYVKWYGLAEWINDDSCLVSLSTEMLLF